MADCVVTYHWSANREADGSEANVNFEDVCLYLNIRSLVVSKTGDYTAADEGFILVDASSAAVTITLPASVSNTNRVYHIKKTDSSGNAVTIDGNASETIDDATTVVIAAQYEAVSIVCDGSNWHIF